MTFKPGQSGNPGGRPKVEAEVIKLAQQASPDAIRKLVKWANSDDARASIPACNSLLDRAIGKPKQQLEHTGQDGGAIITKITVEIIGG